MIKCVAIDDEPIALSILEEYARRYGDIEFNSFTSPLAGIEYIRKNNPDIVFLDIEMSTHNGLELAKDIPDDICLIFTTAFSQYALDGFNVDAIDFLHKPIFYPRFEKAMDKAKKWMGVRDSEESLGSITIKVEHKTVVVKLEDILYVEAMDNYVKIFRKEHPMVLTQITMKEMETLLPSQHFMRVHRSFIISLDCVENFSNRLISLNGVKTPIPIGRKYIQTMGKLKKEL